MKYCLYLFLLASLCFSSACSTSPTETPVVPTHTVSVEVPGMNCPIEHWPKVQRILEAEPGAAMVTLADQPDGAPSVEEASAVELITNPFVYVDVNGDFDAEHAIKSLAALDLGSVKITTLASEL